MWTLEGKLGAIFEVTAHAVPQWLVSVLYLSSYGGFGSVQLTGTESAQCPVCHRQRIGPIVSSLWPNGAWVFDTACLAETMETNVHSANFLRDRLFGRVTSAYALEYVRNGA